MRFQSNFKAFASILACPYNNNVVSLCRQILNQIDEEDTLVDVPSSRDSDKLHHRNRRAFVNILERHIMMPNM